MSSNAFLTLYWTGICFGELLALLLVDFNVEGVSICRDFSFISVSRVKNRDLQMNFLNFPYFSRLLEPYIVN